MPIGDFTGTAKINPWRTIQGPALLELAPLENVTPTISEVTASSSWSAVGITGEISFNPNISSEESYCAQLKHPYAIDVSRRAEQISTELQELDIWNFAMALSYNSSVVTDSSYFYLDAQNTGYAAGGTGQANAYRHVRLTTEGISDDGSEPSATQTTILSKARPIGEEVTYGPETKSTIPITLHAVACGASGAGEHPDRVGVMYNQKGISNPGY